MMELFSLKGKVAVVTGGNRGLGKTFALSLAKMGADVVIVGRDELKNLSVIKEIESYGRRAISLSVDLQDISAIKRMVETVKNEFRKIDILVNNAGVSKTGLALDVEEEEWDKIMDLNVKSLFFCSRAIAKEMKEQKSGKIINIASVVGA
ncbi:MAG TPA: SDR family NAD(P)-dependent oxidoreductase, partial [Bacilli bacterium]|nr:SDR family NAD(P)-dependent oxidoreductase [Bacilli bacterium]